MRKSILILSFVFTVTLPYACASGEPNETNSFLALRDYLGYAESHNAGLKSSEQQWQTAIEQIPQAKALPDPKINYGYYTRQSDMQMRQMAGVMQEFPWFGKIDARTETAIKEASAAQKTYEVKRLALFKEVKEGFYEFAYLAAAINIAKENLELMKHFEEVAQIMHMTAEASHPDVIRAQVETAKLEDVLRGLGQLREPTVSRLTTALNLPADTNLPWPKTGEFNAVELDYQQLVNILRQRNPQLAGLNFEAMAAESKITLAEKNFYPDIGVGVEWSQFDKSGGNSGHDAVALVFQMNLPLWRDSYSAGERQARAQKVSIEQEKIDMENALLTKASQAHYEYRDSIRKIRLYQDTLIPKGRELLRASEAAYRQGTIDFLSLIDAQRMLLEYHLSLQRAIANNQQKLAELEMLAGTELEIKKQN